ncbi:MAG: hypothetical protein U9P88_01630 [Patescibacteria group bacterium]|nr:hypothetical protein [Patescibacteria group bacterium]
MGKIIVVKKERDKYRKNLQNFKIIKCFKTKTQKDRSFWDIKKRGR